MAGQTADRSVEINSNDDIEIEGVVEPWAPSQPWTGLSLSVATGDVRGFLGPHGRHLAIYGITQTQLSKSDRHQHNSVSLSTSLFISTRWTGCRDSGHVLVGESQLS
jgi:hypothetical protein